MNTKEIRLLYIDYCTPISILMNILISIQSNNNTVYYLTIS